MQRLNQPLKFVAYSTAKVEYSTEVAFNLNLPNLIHLIYNVDYLLVAKRVKHMSGIAVL